MTTEELKAKTSEICGKFGKPEWDNYAPANESARKIAELRKIYHVERAGNNKINNKKGLEGVYNSIEKQKVKEYLESPIPELFLSKQDLMYFTDVEAKIIEDKFQAFNQTNKELAKKHNVDYQFVTSLLDSPAYKALYIKKFDQILPIESLIAIRVAMKKGDSKVALEIARHYKLIKDESSNLNLTSKLIDDPEAIKTLKSLGDKLA